LRSRCYFNFNQVTNNSLLNFEAAEKSSLIKNLDLNLQTVSTKLAENLKINTDKIQKNQVKTGIYTI